MSFNLSDILNPAPTDARSDHSPQDDRKSSLPPLHIPSHSSIPLSNTQTSTSDTAAALASLSSNSRSPSATFQTGMAGSPSATHDGHDTVGHVVRRPSLYGDPGPLPASDHKFQPRSPEIQRLPYSSESSRKMSSPSLEHYHVSARSPDQRRPSLIGDPGYTLPPLQQIQTTFMPSKEEQGKGKGDTTAIIGDDTSAYVSASAPLRSGNANGSLESAQAISEQREPDYTRNEPSTSQIIGADSMSEVPDQASTQAKSSDMSHHSPVDVKQEPAIHSSIPAFIPVPSIKREQSTQSQTPLRESSIPVPTTEETPSEELRGKKRPAPKSTNKKGTAKKGPPSKKRKTETSASSTPSAPKSKPAPRSTNLKKATSASATPLNSSPAPRSVRTASSVEPDDADSDDDDEDEPESPEPAGPDDEVYCICRRPDSGTFMIGCDGGCDDWFHGKCVGVPEKNKGLIDRYICPNCEKQDKGVTTWKRMCRRDGCRMPARVGKKKGEEPSKYCSEDCGILFFKGLMEKTRGAEPNSTSKMTSTRKSVSGSANGNAEDDLGPRGGVLSIGEVKALVTAVPDIDAFKRLGEGVLSPPATPSPTALKTESKETNTDATLNDAERERLAAIAKGKDEARARNALLKDKTKFITMMKNAATRIATEQKMKPKEMCGYDSRADWSEEQFDAWRQSKTGADALAAGTLDRETATTSGDVAMTDGTTDGEDVEAVCTKRKCTRHYDWSKLALDDARFELGENSERMRRLDREEKEVRERAGLRARELKAGGTGGIVIMHDTGVPAAEGASVVKIEKADMASMTAVAEQGLGIQNEPTDTEIEMGASIDAVGETTVTPLAEAEA